jgi:hypothetical protein
MRRRCRHSGGLDSRRARRNEGVRQGDHQPESLRTLIRLVWQAGTVAWIGGGVLLIAAPSFGSESARHWIVATIVAVYAFAAAANAWWSRGRGFGWKALGAVVVLAVAGY